VSICKCEESTTEEEDGGKGFKACNKRSCFEEGKLLAFDEEDV